MTDDGLEQNPFNEAAKRAHYEAIIPRLKDIHAHDDNLKPEDVLKLGECEVGQEITLEFYPSQFEPEIKPIRLVVTGVGENSIDGLASGGPKDWVDKKVGIGCSTIVWEGSMARPGVIEPGLYPEFHYMDEEKRAKDIALLKEIYTKQHSVFINGIKFDDKYFDEYRTDLSLPTTEERINWLVQIHGFGRSKCTPGELATWKVEEPQPIELPKAVE